MSACRCIAWDAELPTWAQQFVCDACAIECCSLCAPAGDGRLVLCADCSSESAEALLGRTLNDMLAWPRYPPDCETQQTTACECLPCTRWNTERVLAIDELQARGLLKPYAHPSFRENRAWNHPDHLTDAQCIARDAARVRRRAKERRVKAARLWKQRAIHRSHRRADEERAKSVARQQLRDSQLRLL